MKTEIHIGQLLRWRLARAEAEAPRAARLLELSRPWWETLPERFSGGASFRMSRAPDTSWKLFSLNPGQSISASISE